MESFFLAVKVKTHQTQLSQNRVGHEKVFKILKNKVFGQAKNDYSIKARFCLFLTLDKNLKHKIMPKRITLETYEILRCKVEKKTEELTEIEIENERSD